VTTLLVTGVAGFIGTNYLYSTLRKYPERQIIGLDKLTYAGNFDNFSALSDEEQARFTFVRGDISDRDLVESVFTTYPIDGVVNFAAESHVDRSIHDPSEFLRTNILGTGSLLEAAKNSWSENGSWREGTKFLQVSTDEVYGSLGPEGYFSESTSLDPHSPYSASKAAADLLVKAYHYTYGMPVVITRCSNNYGPYQFPEKLIPLMILNMLEGKPLPVYGDGKNVRDWLYVEDHAAAIWSILNKGAVGETYNIGGENEWENIKLVNVLCELVAKATGKGIDHYSGLITYVKDRPGHDRRYAISCDRIKRELGWVQSVSFIDGLDVTVQWYLKNGRWIENIKSGGYKKWIDLNYGKRDQNTL
jgi:dTDP-glucose 4,6-dehydratase